MDMNTGLFLVKKCSIGGEMIVRKSIEQDHIIYFQPHTFKLRNATLDDS